MGSPAAGPAPAPESGPQCGASLHREARTGRRRPAGSTQASSLQAAVPAGPPDVVTPRSHSEPEAGRHRAPRTERRVTRGTRGTRPAWTRSLAPGPRGTSTPQGAPQRQAHSTDRREARGAGISPRPGAHRGRSLCLRRPRGLFHSRQESGGQGGPHTAGTPAHGSGAGAAGSDGQGDEAVVTLDAPLEDLGAGAQHALEAGPVQLHALEGPAGHHGGRPGPVQQQRDLPCGRQAGSGVGRPPGEKNRNPGRRGPTRGPPLTEVVGGPEAPHLHVLLVGGPALQDGGRALWRPSGHVRRAALDPPPTTPTYTELPVFPPAQRHPRGGDPGAHGPGGGRRVLEVGRPWSALKDWSASRAPGGREQVSGGHPPPDPKPGRLQAPA